MAKRVSLTALIHALAANAHGDNRRAYAALANALPRSNISHEIKRSTATPAHTIEPRGIEIGF